jgi:hypothetical protein
MVAGKKSTAASSRRWHAQGLRWFWVLGFGIGTIDFHLPFLISQRYVPRDRYWIEISEECLPKTQHPRPTT